MKLDTAEDDIQVDVDDQTGAVTLTLTGDIKFGRRDGYDTYLLDSMELSDELAKKVGENLLDAVED
jgi:hypothetical protein